MKLRYGVRETALTSQGDAQIQMSFSIAWLQTDDFFKLCLCPREIALQSHLGAKHVMSFQQGGLNTYCFTETPDRLVSAFEAFQDSGFRHLHSPIAKMELLGQIAVLQTGFRITSADRSPSELQVNVRELGL
jgi:hypothetical protein